MRTFIFHFLITSWLFSTALANVYVCMGPSSKKYHSSSDCRGLSNCSTRIYEVTQKEASEKFRRTACKICYR